MYNNKWAKMFTANRAQQERRFNLVVLYELDTRAVLLYYI